MVVITNFNPDSFLNEPSKSPGNFQVESGIENSKVVNFFELLYSYPAKYKIKWNALDELKEDLFLPSNYNALGSNLPFVDSLDDWIFSDDGKKIQLNSEYNLKDLRDGFLDKQYSSKFYRKQTKDIQQALSSVPVYVVLNGLNEIILNKPRNLENSQTTNKFLKQVIYDYCGAFDSALEGRQQLGFFFMNKSDAEAYLQEIAKSDMNGTEIVGLSIHCISLDSAYNVTREHHPGIDFRIVPNLHEVKDLLKKHISKTSIIVDDEQQQLRFRKRSVNVLPVLGRLGSLLSPSFSFIQRDEYFKGVPIYVVQTLAQPRNISAAQYFNIVGFVDTVYGNLIQTFNSLAGFGHNSIMQGSIKESSYSDQVTNYVFFDEIGATKFIKNNEKNIKRYKGSRTSKLESLVRKPKIFVYNLEDFIESWEEKILSDKSENQTIFDAENTLFIPSEQTYKETQLFFESNDSNAGTQITQQIFQQLDVKFRVFKNFVGVLFSIGY